ncbi:MAG: hypothetical protein KBT03_08915 [Bacteroidales bacterium]|nr:hypothetical protein [Candidatus Scybalousia scybalohippi]
MKYIVYLTLCTSNNKIYVGVHETNNPEIFDGYLGNGVYTSRPASYKRSTTPFKFAVNKYGINSFKRMTLKVFDTAEEAYKFESEIVTDEFIRRKDTYNIKLGGSGGCPEVLKRKVYMYNSSGVFVAEFDCLMDCMRYINPEAKNASHISRAIRLGQRVLGYQFSYEKLEFMKDWKPKKFTRVNNLPEIPHNKEFRKIGRYDMEGNLIQIYSCLSECKKDGYKNAKYVIQGKRSHCKGFKFQYIEEV